MAIATRLGFGAVLALMLPLGGCVCFEQPRAESFVAPHIYPHSYPHWHRHLVITAIPVAAQAAETELSKCRTGLYLKSASSQDDLHALEAKCRAIILNQTP